ncbi:hypothetical protein IWQ61_000940 [Dispira simplex]|nr:hypothetical protein IWQ61_000940 [Dispira simplex]
MSEATLREQSGDPVLGDDTVSEYSSDTETGPLGEPQACLFVANLNISKTDHELYEDVHTLFSEYGEILELTVNRTKQGIPYAFVQFQHSEDANRAYTSAKGRHLHNRSIRIEHAKVTRTLICQVTDPAVNQKGAQSIMQRYGEVEDSVFWQETTNGLQSTHGMVKYRYRSCAIRALRALWRESHWTVEWSNYCTQPPSLGRPSQMYGFSRLSKSDGYSSSTGVRSRARGKGKYSSSPSSGGSAPRPIVCMKTVFIGNLKAQMDTATLLRAKCVEFGKVEDVELVRGAKSYYRSSPVISRTQNQELVEDHLTNKGSPSTWREPNTYAFVRFNDELGATKAIVYLDGQEWQGRRLRVTYKLLNRPHVVGNYNHGQRRYNAPTRPWSMMPFTTVNTGGINPMCSYYPDMGWHYSAAGAYGSGYAMYTPSYYSGQGGAYGTGYGPYYYMPYYGYQSPEPLPYEGSDGRGLVDYAILTAGTNPVVSLEGTPATSSTYRPTSYVNAYLPIEGVTLSDGHIPTSTAATLAPSGGHTAGYPYYSLYTVPYPTSPGYARMGTSGTSSNEKLTQSNSGSPTEADITPIGEGTSYPTPASRSSFSDAAIEEREEKHVPWSDVPTSEADKTHLVSSANVTISTPPPVDQERSVSYGDPTVHHIPSGADDSKGGGLTVGGEGEGWWPKVSQNFANPNSGGSNYYHVVTSSPTSYPGLDVCSYSPTVIGPVHMAKPRHLVHPTYPREYALDAATPMG